MREYVTCAAPPEGVEDEDAVFNQFCREHCTTRRIARRCDPCVSCLCGGYSCRPATSDEIVKARMGGTFDG